MYRVHDWAEVHRLHREGKTKAVIAGQLGMSRTTVIRLLRLPEPPDSGRDLLASKTFIGGPVTAQYEEPPLERNPP